MPYKKFPLWIAILININIVIGGGFFLGVPRVLHTSGLLAPFSWALVGLLLLPLTLIIAKFSNIYPNAGGIFVYSDKVLGSFLGFLCGWGYFIGTAAGNAALLHAFGEQIQLFGYSVPWLNPLALNIALILFFTILSLKNIEFLESFQVGVTILKTIPIILVIFAAFALFAFTNISNAPVHLSGLASSVPPALFAYIGIEACSSITHQIKDGHKNAARAMLISLGVIITIYSVIQFLLLGIHGTQSLNPFTDILPKLTSNPLLISGGTKLINFAILSSYLGGFYGMFYANNWILYAIGKGNRIFGSQALTKLNKHRAPWVSIIAQCVLLITIFCITININNLILMSDFGVAIAYALTTLAFIIAAKKQGFSYGIGILGLLGCGLLSGAFLEDLVNLGARYIIPFLVMLGMGIVLYLIHHRKQLLQA
jgi:amino acid transporter